MDNIVFMPREFLSTLSLRRATNAAYGALDGASISIHALLAESDLMEFRELLHPSYFYPRSPCGERPDMAKRLMEFRISIHALLAESDQTAYFF